MARDLTGKRAVVTGASSGIGLEFARQLAARGASLIVTARRKERLDSLAEALRKEHGVEVDIVVCDLGKPDGAKALFAATEESGKPVHVLVNNAGFGTRCSFVDAPWEKTLEALQLNVVSLTELTWRFASAMKARGGGHILNVASIGAFLPTPRFASYGAGKSYVRNFSEALAHELSGTGVRVCCLSPGATESEFSDVAGIELAPWQKLAFMSAERCARIGLGALFRGRRSVVSGWLNSLAMFLTRFIPRRLGAAIAAKVL